MVAAIERYSGINDKMGSFGFLTQAEQINYIWVCRTY